MTPPPASPSTPQGDASAQRAGDIDAIMDGMRFGRLHVRVLLLGIVIMLVDGYEVGVLGLVLPKLADDFGVARVSLSWVLSAQQVGMVLGAYFIAPLADRFGRRPLVLWSLAAVAACCCATIFAGSLQALAGWRLVTGLFASTLIANLVAWTSEMAPARLRALMVTIVLTGSTAGAILGSLVQAFVLEAYGWRGAFWIGAVLPAILVAVAYAAFDESPRFLAERDPADPRLARFLRHAVPNGASLTVIATADGQAPARLGRVRDLFAPGLAVATLLLWLCFVLDFLFITAWFWKTTIFHDILGLGWKTIAVTTGMEVVCGGIGMLTIGWLVGRFGFRAMVPAYFLLAAVAMVAMGRLAPGWGMFGALAVMATAQNAGHASLAIVASGIYDTRNRGTGVGWAYGAGRIASIIGPLAGAVPMQLGWGALPYFGVLAIPLVAAAVASYLLLGQRAIDPPAAATRAH